MIVCSCNLLSDTQVRSAVTSGVIRPRISHVYASLGCTAQCGRCVHTIKAFLTETIDMEPRMKQSKSQQIVANADGHGAL
jgi:bacterioferritin-associated ferredoxin